jgi:hypothetical protein
MGRLCITVTITRQLSLIQGWMMMVMSFLLFFFMGSSFAIRRIMMLEFSQYLENYLWPNYVTSKSSHAHMMSIVIMINEKFRERVPAWQVRLCVCVVIKVIHESRDKIQEMVSNTVFSLEL